jgi:stage II sporulation protein D
LDDYLKATLPREMPPNFHIEALKAQAVAARSFTMRRLNRYRQWGYDLCDHAPCQVYGGVDAEDPNTNRAVEATAGEVLDPRRAHSGGGLHGQLWGAHCTD